MMNEKIKTPQQLLSVLAKQKEDDARVVFTNGCFDLLHIGHIRYLQQAKTLGDLLVVAVNSDASIRTLRKGRGRPIIPETERLEVVAALACVDYAILFDEPSPLQIIQTVQPDILVKGEDWSRAQIIGGDVVEARGGIVHRIPLVPHVSTSQIIQRIQRLVPTLNHNPERSADAHPALPNSPPASL